MEYPLETSFKMHFTKSKQSCKRTGDAVFFFIKLRAKLYLTEKLQVCCLVLDKLRNMDKAAVGNTRKKRKRPPFSGILRINLQPSQIPIF